MALDDTFNDKDVAIDEGYKRTSCCGTWQFEVMNEEGDIVYDSSRAEEYYER